ncbi:hypothetical protein VHEMI02181 [[Torrubiella] hemipterigena]|uniref:C6 transcription factor n=1 Tax=[Torrubiella] hemipterigena TaxID=1531966 RepID=A0A0A1T745_9HYPO|nr:hypothetical protein VHEMI02181 [[Torrubiella] hemipterigena]
MVSTRASSSRAGSAAPETPATPSSPSRSKRSSGNAASSSGFQHNPTFWTMLWMGISLPLVIWDTIYVLGRPHTMEGGWMHKPFWAPYKLYGEVDHVYGWKAFNAGNGFTSAQGALNAIETAMYFYYLAAFYNLSGVKAAVSSRTASVAAIVGFSAAVMTLSKTLLYWLNEYYSGFDNIGHNDLLSLIFLWIIPNGAWLVGSTYMIVSLGQEIVDGLAGHAKSD